MTTFRIHGDNIVECERVTQIILDALKPNKITTQLIAPSTTMFSLQSSYDGEDIDWHFELLPCFKKKKKKRWPGNIFDSLKEAGSFFDETPDVIISEIDKANQETILLAIEFCSALQAGNQAWQRSARAFSVGRTGCPYLYIVDFVKYELNNATRARKNLRFPNAAVPYSYISYSKNTGNFIAQLYIQSEEFDKSRDPALRDFHEADFSHAELGIYIIKLLLHMDTAKEETAILDKNMHIVEFLARKSKEGSNYTANEFREISSMTTGNIVDYAVQKNRFIFHKTIANDSHHGDSERVVELIDSLSTGLASKDLPFGIIPAKKRTEFADELQKIYPDASPDFIRALGSNQKHLIITVFKGFKPRGDDNRPDRGLLPLVSMLSSADVDTISYIYGPVLQKNLELLDKKPEKLAKKNGLWRSILALSNFVVLDVPVLDCEETHDAIRFYDTTSIKNSYHQLGQNAVLTPQKAFPCIPTAYGEDDVDTAIHYFFTHILGSCCFEGMCNPPGGDWSGFSIIDGIYEKRWLSLPRVSSVISGKRPDHILQISAGTDKPVLLSIESKEKSSDLEQDVGTKLVTYIKAIMKYTPSVQRDLSTKDQNWERGSKKADFNSFETISVAAYLRKYAQDASIVFATNCEILFVLEPLMNTEITGWEIEIIPSTERSQLLKDFIINQYISTGDNQFILK